MFTRMARADWLKKRTGTSDSRLKILKHIIVDGDPISNWEGKDVYIKNTRENTDILDEYSNDDDQKTFTLITEDNGKIISTDIGKSAVFGGYGRGNVQGFITDIVESLHCLYLAAMVQEGTDKNFAHFTTETLAKYKRKIKVNVPYNRMIASAPQWHFSAYTTAAFLIKKGYITNQHIFHHKSKEVTQIYVAKQRAFKSENRKPLNDDKWNPGDIWAIKNVFNPKHLSNDSVRTLNIQIKNAFLGGDCIAVSLKQIAKLELKAKGSEYNIATNIPETHSLNKITLKTSQRNPDVWSSKGGFIFYDRTKKMSVRCADPFAAINMELSGKGARGGKVGLTQIRSAADKFLGVSIPDNMRIRAEARDIYTGNKRQIKMFWNMVKKIHSDVKYGGFQVSVSEATHDSIHANLSATYILHAMACNSKTQQNEFVSHAINIAGSKTDDSSAFIKVESA